MTFKDKLRGAVYGTAIGDAMGAPVEGWPPERILEDFGAHGFETFLPPTHVGDPEKGKGAGRITDDTLMTEALILAYAQARSHLDAYGYLRHLLPQVKERRCWIPEWQQEACPWERLWHPEKYPWLRLLCANAEPRTAGVGNMVNCGVAMWMMPAGAVNAGDPRAAYQEAVLLGSAHNESFAVEAGAVMAAAAAEALSDAGTLESVLDTAAALGEDGTGRAVSAAVAAAESGDALTLFIRKTRAAIMPFDPRSGHGADDQPLERPAFSDVGRPSRIHAIEELPVALAALRYGQGDALKTLKAAVCYGRDCDSIAGMAMALFGALYGVDALPAGLCAAADRANRRNFAALADLLHEAARTILAEDRVHFRRREQSV